MGGNITWFVLILAAFGKGRPWNTTPYRNPMRVVYLFMKIYPAALMMALLSGSVSAQTSNLYTSATNAQFPLITSQTNGARPFYYTSAPAAPVTVADGEAQNHWDMVSNYFKTNFLVGGTNVTPAFSNWAANNKVYAQTPAPRWTTSNAWLAFSNWVQTNSFASSTPYTNTTTLTPTGRTATNANPSLEKRLRNDFNDVKDEVHDLFRKKTNSP